MHYYDASKITSIAANIHTENKRWWVDKDGNPLNPNFGEKIALIHSEISEALEGFRKNLPDSHLPKRPAVEVELADAVIRIFDLAGAYQLDIGGAMYEKLQYNKTRKDHTYEEREKANGKKF